MSDKVFATNRKAFHDYHVLETLEAGIALTGTEVKSVRAGGMSLRDAYAQVQGGEVWLFNSHIAPYDRGNRYNHETDRPRKLLLHKMEIGRLMGKVQQAGNTLVPLRAYDLRGRVKVELALARGKRQYDKREAIADREARREIDRAMKEALAR
ncbi:MAG: SsrA-binding protein SmpB [Chloroflexi bacterium]|nr:SsrA-binding protein SmpB [Chloroflexota bacterium]